MSVSNKFTNVGIEQELARRSHLEFMKYTWMKKGTPLIVGFHTSLVCRKIDEAFERYRQGKSTYLMVKIPFRHGKSDMLSRYLPPHFLGEFPEAEVITTGYGGSLLNKFSRDARAILRGNEYQSLYHNSKPSKEAFNVQEWSLSNGLGKTLWTGMDGGMTGNGFDLGLVDDPFKNRQEAESEGIREKRWDSFTNDFLTRGAPVHIVILLATPWHTDDLFGRIKEAMAKDPDFPRFEELTFPARAEDYDGEGEYTGEFLFEERFPRIWYKRQYAQLGPYNASGLLDCDPEEKAGRMLGCEEGVNWHYVDSKPEGFGRLGRGWDLASGSAERQGEDPDYTIGVKGAIKKEMVPYLNSENKESMVAKYHLYIEDITRMREEAPKRNRVIKSTAIADGTSVIQGVEAFGPYKDAYTQLRDTLKGIRKVIKMQLSGDKVAKASDHIELPLDDGNVYVNRRIPKKTLDEFWSTMKAFPLGKHDDDVDAFTVMVALCKENKGLLFEDAV